MEIEIRCRNKGSIQIESLNTKMRISAGEEPVKVTQRERQVKRKIKYYFACRRHQRHQKVKNWKIQIQEDHRQTIMVEEDTQIHEKDNFMHSPIYNYHERVKTLGI